MYNLLITSNETAWEKFVYEYELDRFLEYTTSQLKSKFKSLNQKVFDKLMKIPTLFLYERFQGIAKLGYITSIQKNSKVLRIKFSFENSIAGFDAQLLNDLKLELNISSWEENRTHWAIKDEDIFSILSTHGIINKQQQIKIPILNKISDITFDVAFSFPGEKRDEVLSIVNSLKDNYPDILIFYDADYTAQLAAPNLVSILQNIYGKQALLLCVFLCDEYENKDWCKIEWKAISEILNFKNPNQIMYLRSDKTQISGGFRGDGYIEVEKFSPKQISEFIHERILLLKT